MRISELKELEKQINEPGYIDLPYGFTLRRCRLKSSLRHRRDDRLLEDYKYNINLVGDVGMIFIVENHSDKLPNLLHALSVEWVATNELVINSEALKRWLNRILLDEIEWMYQNKGIDITAL